MTLPVLGLDIGGANLKAAHSSGVAALQPYALWKNAHGLADALEQLLRGLPPYASLAVTMTGELCDCFETKRQGVETILDAVARCAGQIPTRIWRNDGTLVSPAIARADPLSVAAANWLALATFVGRFAPVGPALLIDIGSTTTDLVPLLDGKPIPRGRSDPERLRVHELVYLGARRTPLCALLGARGAAEFFATTLDVALVLGDVPEDAADHDTADGRPATRAAAHARLARMWCADRETCTEAETQALAGRLRRRQLGHLRRAVQSVLAPLPGPPVRILTAGSGEFLTTELLAAWPEFMTCRLSLAERLGPSLSAAACAYALAILTAEAIDHEQC